MPFWKTLKDRMTGPFDAWAASSPFGFSFVLTTVFFTIVYCFFTAYYQENDDVFKLFFVKGVGTGLAPSEFLGHSNILAGFLLSHLYSWNTYLPWYALYLSIPLFGGIWAMGAAFFLASRNAWLRIFFWGLLCVGLFTYYLYQYEFAITPQIAAQGALLLVAAVLERKDAVFQTKAFTLAFVLIATACVIRLDSLLLTLLVAIPWLLYFAWRHRRRFFQKKFVTFVVLVSTFVVCATLFSSAYYNHSPGWKKFLEFNHLIESLKDYRNPFFDEKTQPYFEEVGWTENDVWMFRDYCYVDTRINNVENYGKLLPHFSRFTNIGKFGTINSLSDLLRDSQAQTAIMFILLFALFLAPGRRILFVINAIWLLGVFLLLIYFWRCPQRLYLPCLTFLALLVIFEAEKLPASITTPLSAPHRFLRRFALGVVIATLPLILLSYHQQNEKQCVIEYYTKQNVLKLHPQNHQLFVIWDSCFPYESIHAFDDFELFRDFHIYPLAVFQRSPHGEEMLKRFGIQHNLFYEMQNRSDIFLMCRPFESGYYSTYMAEKFQIKIQATDYFNSKLFKIYNIKSEKTTTEDAISALGMRNH